jgi:hypothetical protein
LRSPNRLVLVIVFGWFSEGDGAAGSLFSFLEQVVFWLLCVPVTVGRAPRFGLQDGDALKL